MISGNATAASHHCSHAGTIMALTAVAWTGNTFSGFVLTISGFAYFTAGRIVAFGAVFRAFFNFGSAGSGVNAWNGSHGIGFSSAQFDGFCNFETVACIKKICCRDCHRHNTADQGKTEKKFFHYTLLIIKNYLFYY